jgi:hypothetical protein
VVLIPKVDEPVMKAEPIPEPELKSEPIPEPMPQPEPEPIKQQDASWQKQKVTKEVPEDVLRKVLE